MENGNTAGVYIEGQNEWKKIVEKKTVLIVGLFFSVLFLVIYGCYRIEEKIENDTQIKAGMLLLKHPKLEADIIELLFEDKGKLTAEEKENLKNIGKELQRKYGYDDETSLINSIGFIGYRFIGFVFFLFCVMLGFVLGSSKKEYEKIYTGLEDILDYLEQYLKGNYNYMKIHHSYSNAYINDICEKAKELGNVIECFMKKMEQEKEETKELVTDISHQLKTPLASLKMSYEIMTSSRFTEEERLEFLNHGKEEIEKLQLLLNSLIKVSRLEASMIKIVPQKAKLKETIIRAVQTIYIKASKKDITIEMDECKEMEVYFDSKWTQEVFINILDNAVKYSPEHTGVTIRVTEMISYILIEIEDEGIGIEKKEYSKIFQRFYRGDKKEVKEQEGSGVGLYLSRKILEAQGGTIRVKSGKKQGSIFLVTIPKNYDSYKTVS